MITIDILGKSSLSRIDEEGKRMSSIIRIAEENLNEHAVDFVESVAYTITQKVRNYIPAQHRQAPGQTDRYHTTATGRLWSGFGVRRDVKTTAPEHPEDNIFRIRKTSQGATLELGTRIRYAIYVSQGRPSWHKGRTAYGFQMMTEVYLDYDDEEIREQLEYFQARVLRDFSGIGDGRSRRSRASSIQSRRRLRNRLGQFVSG